MSGATAWLPHRLGALGMVAFTHGSHNQWAYSQMAWDGTQQRWPTCCVAQQLSAGLANSTSAVLPPGTAIFVDCQRWLTCCMAQQLSADPAK
eukprot:1139583-Pelagomonas_calceolata.AAC.6